MSSVCGLVSAFLASIYSAAKGAMNQLAKNLACEWARDNIRANAVVPWFIRTPLSEPVKLLVLFILLRLSPIIVKVYFRYASYIACNLTTWSEQLVIV